MYECLRGGLDFTKDRFLFVAEAIYKATRLMWVVVMAGADEAATLQFLAPYTGATVA